MDFPNKQLYDAIKIMQESLNYFDCESPEGEEKFNAMVTVLSFAKYKSGYKQEYEPETGTCDVCGNKVRIAYGYNGHGHYKCKACGTIVMQ